MATNPIQWFPGHMAKTKRMMRECLSEVDIIIELLDARIPYSSKNPEINSLINGKPKITVFTKSTLADPDMTAKWVDSYAKRGEKVVVIDSTTGAGIEKLADAVREVMAEKLERYHLKGMDGRKLKAMIVAIPNVGKSSLINRIAGNKKAKVEDRPGVTMTKQWVTTSVGLELLDMPGVLWPKFEDPEVGMKLAYTGAVKEDILDIEELAVFLMKLLWTHYPDAVKARYGIEMPEDATGYELLEAAGRKRGFLMARAEVNTERMAKVLLDEYRSGKLGKFTLEMPPKEEA